MHAKYANISFGYGCAIPDLISAAITTDAVTAQIPLSLSLLIVIMIVLKINDVKVNNEYKLYIKKAPAI